MTHLGAFAIAALFIAATVSAAEPAWRIEYTPGKRIAATLKFEVHCPTMEAKQWLLFVPRAPALPSQAEVTTKVEPIGAATDDSRLRERKVIVVRVSGMTPGARDTAAVTVRYGATLVARKLTPVEDGPFIPKVADLSPNDRKAYLAATKSANHDNKAFGEMLDREGLRRRGEEDAREAEIEFARRVYAFAKDKGKYEFRGDTERHAADVAATWKTDCGGWSNWFVAVMRAGGVPARVLVGRWAKSATEGDRLDGQPHWQEHVKAEFFAAGVGWVPVDISQAVQHERASDERYFGNDEADFFTLHVDTDFQFVTREAGKREYFALQTPPWWVTGKGDTKGWKATRSWDVETGGSVGRPATTNGGRPATTTMRE